MGEEEVDGSFKKPGAIPFKWETRPGVPKPDPQPLSYDNNNEDQEEDNRTTYHSSSSSPTTPQPLTPPPRTQSLRSVSRLRSDLRWYESDPPLLAQPESLSAGCFLSPRLRWKWGWKKLANKAKSKPETKIEPEPKLGSLARWSITTHKSLSPLRGSPSSLSFSSRGSSP